MNKKAFKRRLRILKRKKWFIPTVIILAVALVVTPFFYSITKNHSRFSVKNPIELSTVFIKKTERQQINLIAHRGFSGIAPENTIPAVEKAGEYGFDAVEINIRPTEDGVWVVAYDDDLSTMTDKNGSISGKTYYDIVECNIVKGANHKKYENLKIPTFEHILETFLQYNIKPIIVIEDYRDNLLDNLLEIIDKNGYTKSCTIISSEQKLLDTIRNKNSDIALYKSVEKLTESELSSALSEKSIGICLDISKKINTEQKIKKLLDADIQVMCYTVNDAETMQKLFALGVTDFITDRIYE